MDEGSRDRLQNEVTDCMVTINDGFTNLMELFHDNIEDHADEEKSLRFLGEGMKVLSEAMNHWDGEAHHVVNALENSLKKIGQRAKDRAEFELLVMDELDSLPLTGKDDLR